MIDVSKEHLITLRTAAAHPLLRNADKDKPVHISRVYRWALEGARAVDGQRIRLETIKVPAGLRTTQGAIVAFVHRLTHPDAKTTPTPPAERRKQIDAARQRLAAAGI